MFCVLEAIVTFGLVLGRGAAAADGAAADDDAFEDCCIKMISCTAPVCGTYTKTQRVSGSVRRMLTPHCRL